MVTFYRRCYLGNLFFLVVVVVIMSAAVAVLVFDEIPSVALAAIAVGLCVMCLTHWLLL